MVAESLVKAAESQETETPQSGGESMMTLRVAAILATSTSRPRATTLGQSPGAGTCPLQRAPT